jgi:exosome complex RNA-binding protein Rrp4
MNEGQIAVSANGEVWVRKQINGYPSIKSICWSPKIGKFIAIATIGDTWVFISSEDALNWTVTEMPYQKQWNRIVWID